MDKKTRQNNPEQKTGHNLEHNQNIIERAKQKYAQSGGQPIKSKMESNEQ